MKTHIALGAVLGCVFAIATQPAAAGPFADDMAKCLVRSTSDSDRADLVRWIYSAMSLHPDLAAMAKVSAKDRDDLQGRASKLFSRLMFESCRSEFVQAVKNEGPATIEYAFSVLGQVAMRGLMSDSHVSESFQALGKSLDENKLKALVAEAGKK